MTRFLLTLFAIALSALAASAQDASEPAASAPLTLEDYEASIASYGVPFYTRYPASIYTGFAMRVEDPRRIHFRAGRGNQVRVTAMLDEYSVMTYLYSLRKRYETYEQARAKGAFELRTTEHLDAYLAIVDSPAYEIRKTLDRFDEGKLSRPELYTRSLEIMSELNPGRIRSIEIDLKSALKSWRDDVRDYAKAYEGDPGDLAAIQQFVRDNPNDAIVLTNAMVFGRVNAVFLDDAQIGELAALVAAAADKSLDDGDFVEKAFPYFESATHGAYAFRTAKKKKLVPALQCEKPSRSCELRYPEFTAIYPNGSAIASATDRKGNTINLIRNSALMTFIARRYHDVDHIRSEGYYGYAPKMDWQPIGNGVHNPGVSHHLPGMKHLYEQVGIGPDYQFLWVVSRGPVSSGCIRASQGHLWEIRHIFPADTERMNDVLYFGNASEDYDVFDIDADGTPEVVGSDYVVAYSLRGASGDAKRRGKGFSLADASKEDFYTHLYGEVGQFEREGDSYWFTTPYVTHFRREAAGDREGSTISRPLKGRYQLWEQPYERDKVQIYHLNAKYRPDLEIRDNTKSTGKQMVRIFGRVSGCGPFADEWDACYEDEFDGELAALLEML